MITSSIDKITFVVAEIIFKVSVMPSVVVKINYVGTATTCLKGNISLLVAKITFVAAEITI